MICPYCLDGKNIPRDNPLSCAHCGHKGTGPAIYGKTNYFPLCEQANKEIERLKEDLRKQDTSLLLANQNLEQEVEELEGKIEKAIEILKDSQNKAPTCRIIKALEVLEK